MEGSSTEQETRMTITWTYTIIMGLSWIVTLHSTIHQGKLNCFLKNKKMQLINKLFEKERRNVKEGK